MTGVGGDGLGGGGGNGVEHGLLHGHPPHLFSPSDPGS